VTAAARIQKGRWRELDPAIAYDILRLRAAVFVVEQHCAYLDPDGRDLDPAAEHLWISDAGHVVSCLRSFPAEGGGTRIGRIATDPAHRGRGHAARLVREALRRAGRPVVLDAQAQLRDWYARFGFAVSGREWLEDGIAHLPMRLD
jgi:ElaA protein